MAFRLSESSRVLCLLSSESKQKRRESLAAVESDLMENVENSSGEDLKSYCAIILPHLVQSIADTVESHRERSIYLLSIFCEKLDETDCFLPHVTQILTKRLAMEGSREDSEEIRLCSLKLLFTILLKLKNGGCFTADYCHILRHSLEDSYHEVKIKCCDLLKILADKFPAQFYQSAEPLLKPLLKNIVHQQHRVRVATIEAIGVVFQHCNGKFVDYTITPLTQRLFDSSSAVRLAVIKVVGSWLLGLCDRYSYHAKLMPLILCGQIDEIEDIRDESYALWYDIGIKYQKENEKDLKDKIDFDPGKPVHYPANQMRPNFGCRELMHRNASRLLPGLCRDLADWLSETRRKASSLLPIIILHLEAGVTEHTQLLITGLATGIADAISRTTSNSGGGSLFLILMAPQRNLPLLGDLHAPSTPQTGQSALKAPSAETGEALYVLHQLFAAARYTSCFVSSKVWWKLLRENARRCFEATSPTSLAGNYFLLANLIAGASLLELIDCSGTDNVCCCPLFQITHFLTSEDQINCSAFATKAGILECANALTCVLDELIESYKTASASVAGDGSSGPPAPITFLEKICRKALEDIFFQLLAVSASWEDGAERTEFAMAFNDQVGQLLCKLSRHQTPLLPAAQRLRCDFHATKMSQNAREDEGVAEETNACEFKENEVIATAKRAGALLEILYGHQLPKLLRRVEENRVVSGGWHPKSVGLAIFSHAVLSAGPGLLLGLEPRSCKCCTHAEAKPHQPQTPASPPEEENCLLLTLQLLERGCKLNQPVEVCKPEEGGEAEKVAGSRNPLSIATEAELHLRGLLLLVRLTEHARVRLILTRPKLFRYCLVHLVLPSCVWRAGRTAEAMRKAAATSLVALLAAVVPLQRAAALVSGAMEKQQQPAINSTETMLDEWVDSRLEPTRGKVTELLGRNGLLSRRIRAVDLAAPPEKGVFPNLGLVSAASPRTLSSLLARLGGMLTDDVEATRLLACTGLALLFGGIFSGCGGQGKRTADQTGEVVLFVRSPAWFLPLTPESVKGPEVDFAQYGDKMPGLTAPLPGSLGDQVYRFYPCLLKALDDVSDEVRIRAADVFVTWFWVMTPNFVDVPPPVSKHVSSATQSDASPHTARSPNPIYSAVLEDLASGVAVHLDDTDPLIRAAVARVVLRIGGVAPATTRRVLASSRERHRSSALCDALLEALTWRDTA